MYFALSLLIGSLGTAGSAIWVPAADPVAPQASEQSQTTTTTTSQDVPVSTTKTTTVKTTTY